MSNIPVKSNLLNRIGSSVFHMFLYLALMTLISVAATAQSCDGVSLACNNDLNISTNDECRAIICLDIILENNIPGFDDDDYILSATDIDNVPLNLDKDIDGCLIVSEDLAGTTIKVSAYLEPCGISCWGFINIEDKTGPRFLNCTHGLPYGFGTEELNCTNYVDPADVPLQPLAGDCSTNIVPIFRDDTSSVACTGLYTAHIIRTWIAEDEAGNATICKKRIDILKFDLADVDFPPDFIIETDNSDCDVLGSTEPRSIEAHTAGSGFPTGISCPNIMYIYNDIIADSCGIQVKMLRDWLVIDWCNGDTRGDGQVIKIIDQEGPEVICGNDFALPQNFDTLFYPSLERDCRAKILLDPFGVVDSSTKPRRVFDCSGYFLDQVAFLPAKPGTDQPTVGPYRSIEMGDDSLFCIPELVSEIVWARYCYVDACGNGGHIDNEGSALAFNPAENTNCCFFEIRVSHDLAPTPICEGFTKVQLTGGEITEVPASTFDDNSFDLCGGEVRFLARRGSTCDQTDRNFGPYLHFCCNDIGKDIEVTLQVIDEDDNSSTCKSIVNVMNMGTSSTSCPPAEVTIECDEDYTDHDLIGFASSSRSCEPGSKTGQDYFDLTNYNISCNIGEIYRSILVIDADGDTTKVCTQHIDVEATDSSAFLEEGDYTFPKDETIDKCSNQTLHPDFTGYPTTDKEFGCIDIGLTYEDSNPIVSNSNGICYKILRKWTVVDWCRYRPTNPDHYAIYGTQELIIRNSDSPIIECPEMIMVSADTLDCRAHVDLDVLINDVCQSNTDIHWEIDADSDGTVNLRGTGDSASGIYQVGEHKVTFTASNECGGAPSSCMTSFVVKGDRDPLPICLASITWTLNQNGQAIVWASDFDLKSEGGCDGTDSLTFSFVDPLDTDYPQTAATFTCDDVPNGVTNQVALEVFIVDEAGEYSSCSVLLFLQDSNDICPDIDNSTSIGGTVHTEMDQMIEDVMVQLENMTTADMSMDMTGTNGQYAFDEVPYYDDYIIDPEHDVNPLNGVSTIDLVLIQRHILGIQPLSSPYKMIAADINDDGKINGLDLIQLRKLILGVFVDFPQNESWVFVPEAYTFSDAFNPFDYQSSINIEDLLINDMEADFIGIKVGDVNNSSTVSNLDTNIDSRDNSSFYLSGNDVEVKAGELITIPFTAEESADINGFQFTIEFDHQALNFQGIDGSSISMSDNNFALLNNHNGIITVSYNTAEAASINQGDNLFNIFFESKEEGQLSEQVQISSKVLNSEIYTDLETSRNIEYVFRNKLGSENESIELFQNQPNPFSEETIIAFSLPTEQNVSLSIFDSAGKEIYASNGNYKKGINEFVINSEMLKSNGILIYRLQCGETSLTRKMILLR